MNAFARRLAIATIAAFGVLPMAPARAVVSSLITMDDLPNQPINGLVHPAGVTFGFTIGGSASLDARYNAGGPGTTTYINDPSIEGPTSSGAANGAVSLLFNPPVSAVDFGLAMSWNEAIPTGAIVQLFDPANVLIEATPMALTPLSSFSEGFFAYSGTAVRRAVVILQPPQQDVRFAMDDLGFTQVPEPSSAAMIVVALVAASAASGSVTFRQRSLPRVRPRAHQTP